MLYNKKKYEHKAKIDNGKAFGKSFNYEYGRKKAKEIATSSKLQALRNKIK